VVERPLPLQTAWLALPLLLGPGLAGALEDRSGPVRVVAMVLLLAGWGVGVVAALVPRSTSLTVLRVGAPTALAVGLASQAAHPGLAAGLGVAGGALATGAALWLPGVADAFVDGSSYGPERRFCLRLPVPLWLGPVEVVWAAVVAGLASPPLLLAAGRWVWGVVALVAAVPVVVFGARALHQLSRRWLVFVPAGLVVHDPLVVVEPVLFPRSMVRGLGPASSDDAEAGRTVDLTGRAAGLVLEMLVTEPVPLKVRGGRRQGRIVEAERVLITPTRPGAVLAESRRRGYAAVAVPPPSTSSPS
jgi:MFS family permease